MILRKKGNLLNGYMKSIFLKNFPQNSEQLVHACTCHCLEKMLIFCLLDHSNAAHWLTLPLIIVVMAGFWQIMLPGPRRGIGNAKLTACNAGHTKESQWLFNYNHCTDLTLCSLLWLIEWILANCKYCKQQKDEEVRGLLPRILLCFVSIG